MDKVLILGGSAHTIEAVCSARSVFPEAEITLIEENEIFGYSRMGMFYYLAGDIDDFSALHSTVYGRDRNGEFLKSTYDIDFYTGLKITAIDRVEKIVKCIGKSDHSVREFAYDKLLISTDSKSVRPGIKGENLPGVGFFFDAEDAMELVEAAEKNQLENVAIIGSGPVACQLCESFLAMWGIGVTLIDSNEFLLEGFVDNDMARIIEKELIRNKVNLRMGNEVREIKAVDDKLSVIIDNGDNLTGFDRVIFTGCEIPDIEIFKECSLEIGTHGGIKVDQTLKTSDDDIYAVGPNVEVPDMLTGNHGFAKGQMAGRLMHRTAIANLAGGDKAFASTRNSVIKVFDMFLGTVGLTVSEADTNNIRIKAVRGLFSDRAHYYPEAELISAKLLFNSDTGAVLGIQVAGKGYLVRYLDIVSSIIQKGGTIDVLKDFEPAYSPAVTDMEYPLHTLTNYAASVINGGAKGISPFEFKARVKHSCILDVREEYEAETDPVKMEAEEIKVIPFTSLRNRINEIQTDLPIVAVCARGSRSCGAANMLKKAGFKNVSYLSGGLSFFQ